MSNPQDNAQLDTTIKDANKTSEAPGGSNSQAATQANNGGQDTLIKRRAAQDAREDSRMASQTQVTAQAALQGERNRNNLQSGENALNMSSMDSHKEVEMQAQVETMKDWFSKCSVKKDKTLKKLFTLKNSVARRFTTVEYDAWKPSFNSFVSSCGFPGLILVATQVIKFDEHNRLTNLPTEDGGNLEDTPHSIQQK